MYWLPKLLSPVSRLWLARVEGLEHVPHGPVIFAPNHPSYLDGVLLFYLVNWRLRRHIHFFTWKLWWSWVYIPMVHGITLGGAVAKGVKSLKRGHSLGIFPEGGRTFGRRSLPFKTGAATVALLTGRPIVPVSIVYLRQKAMRWKAIVRFGKPIRVKKCNSERVPLALRQQLTNRVRKEIVRLSPLKP
jgi:1-acyl-sn-glycerol-3-phosphate acyltransferase